MKLGKCDFRIQDTSKRKENPLSNLSFDPDSKTIPTFSSKSG